MHFVGQVTDWEGLFCLKCGDEWLQLENAGANAAFPVWPHEPYATAYAQGTRRISFATVPVTLKEWVSRLSPTLGNRLVDVLDRKSVV